MKDSGLKWVGQIPEGWEVNRGKYILRLLNRPVKDDDGVITCFRDGHVTLRSKRREEGFTISLKECGYQGIEPGDLVVHGMDGFAGSIGISDSRGKASPVLNVLDSTESKEYVQYYLRCMAYGDVFSALSTGIRVRSCDLRWNKLANLQYVLPTLPEQRAIAARLDELTGRIESESKKIAAEIERLEQYKKSFITEAVCGRVAVVGAGGVNATTGTTATTATETTATRGAPAQSRPVPEVAEVSGVPRRGCPVDRPPRPMKDSGIPWVGQIPEEWGVDKIKYVFRPTNTRGNKVLELLAATQKYGMYPQSRLEGVVRVAEKTDLNTFKTVHVDDFVISLRSFQGGFERSDYEGVCSPAYQTFHATREIDSLFFKYLFKSPIFISAINRITVGIREGKNINYSDAAEMLIAIPPLSEQHAIAEAIEATCAKIDAIVAKRKQQLDRLDALKRSLVYEYVTGKREADL